MTDQTKCPHCGADVERKYATKTLYFCDTVISDDGDPIGSGQSCECLEIERDNLQAKVAAQQELLRGILKCHTSIGTQTVTAVIPFDLWEKLEAS